MSLKYRYSGRRNADAIGDSVRVEGAPVSAEDLASLPFSANGRTLMLSDVAEIKRGYQDPQQISMRFKGKPVIGLGVVMAPGGNVQTLGKALDKVMTDVEKDLPVGITVHRVAKKCAAWRSGWARTTTSPSIRPMSVPAARASTCRPCPNCPMRTSARSSS